MKRVLATACVGALLVACGGAPTKTPLSGTAVAGAGAAESSCRFRVPFAQFKAELPEVVGDCLDNDRPDPSSGDTVQHTTTGELVLRRVDGRIAFTDGSRTWIQGPSGIEVRGNNERFPWEPTPTPTGVAGIAGGTPAAAGTGTPAAATTGTAVAATSPTTSAPSAPSPTVVRTPTKPAAPAKPASTAPTPTKAPAKPATKP